MQGSPALAHPFPSGGAPARARTWLLYGAALLPALLLLRGIDLHAVDAPFMDDWQFIPLIEKMHRGEIPWSELAAPHDEHRLLLPRILIAASMILANGNYRAQCFVTFATVLAVSFALLFLLRRRYGDEPRTAFFFALGNLVLFSPIQWHNWLWPMQFCYFLPYTFLFVGLAVFFSALAAHWRYAILQTCAWAASFSFVHGLLLWPALAPLVWRDARWPSVRARRAATALWVGAGVLATGLYFHNISHNTALPDYAYYHQGEPPTASTVRMFEQSPVETLGAMAKFAAMMFGNAIGRGLPVASNLEFATVAGALLFAAAIALVVALARRGALAGEGAAWTAIFTHAFATAALVAVGRVWGGPGQPLTPRYATFGTFCLLAAVLLACALFVEVAADRFWRDTALAACGALLATVSIGWSFGWNMMGEWHDARMASRAGIHFSQLLRRVPMLHEAGGQGNVVVAYTKTLDGLGYLDPPLPADLRLDRFAIGDDVPRNEGQLVKVGVDPKGWRVRGHARFGAGGHSPDAILVTSHGTQRDPMIRALCETRSPPRWLRHANMRDYQFAERSPKVHYGSFRCRVHETAIPPEELGAVQFWALDFARLSVHRIRGAVDLRHLEVVREP